MIRLFLLASILLLLSACTLPSLTPGEKAVSSEVVSPTYQQSLDPELRVSLAKKRKNYLSGIRKGDYYSLRNNPEEALRYYLETAEKIPNDQVVRKKIAHVYFLQKNWNSAYANYIQVPIAELSDDEQNEMFQSLFFDASALDRIGEVVKIPIGTGAREYYRVVDVCMTGIHNCIVTIEGYSGSAEKINTLRTTITDSIHISPDYQYRNLAVAAKFYEYGMYGVSAHLTEEILKNRPDYFQAMKILGFSDAELGKNLEAKKILLDYLEKNPNDLESTVRMGKIYADLGDIISSNLSLNNAILAGYTPKTDLERHLAYNYSLLGDIPALIRVMNYLLQESDAKEDDYAVSISLALREGELKRAQMWSDAGLRQFPDSLMLIPLAIETRRLLGDRDAAQMLIENVNQQIFAENPNFLLQKGILLYEQGRIPEAKKIFSGLVDLEEWPEVSEEARTYVKSIDRLSHATGSYF